MSIQCPKCKHCQRHKGPKALSILIHSTHLVQSRTFNKLRNPGQTSAWFSLAKGEKCIEQPWQIHVATLTNPYNFDKSNNLRKNQPGQGLTDWLRDGRTSKALIGLGSDKNVREWINRGPPKQWNLQTTIFASIFVTDMAPNWLTFSSALSLLLGCIGFMGCIHTPAPAQCL